MRGLEVWKSAKYAELLEPCMHAHGISAKIKVLVKINVLISYPALFIAAFQINTCFHIDLR